MASPDTLVLVVGGAAPSVGLYAVAIARALGAGTVTYVARDAGRCAQAERLGARMSQHEGPGPRRFGRAPITVENTADPDGLACTLRSTAPRWRSTSPAPPRCPARLDTKGITLTLGRADSRRHLATVLALVADGHFDPLQIETTVAAWDDAADAWLEPATRLVLRP